MHAELVAVTIYARACMQEEPDLSFGELAKKLGAEWKEMTEKQKEVRSRKSYIYREINEICA